jgi:hypothetical protein
VAAVWPTSWSTERASRPAVVTSPLGVLHRSVSQDSQLPTWASGREEQDRATVPELEGEDHAGVVVPTEVREEVTCRSPPATRTVRPATAASRNGHV